MMCKTRSGGIVFLENLLRAARGDIITGPEQGCFARSRVIEKSDADWLAVCTVRWSHECSVSLFSKTVLLFSSALG
jgi:hypothetical protein